MKYTIFFVLLVGALCIDSFKWYSIVEQENKYEVVEGKNIEGSLAWGYYADETYKDGWGKLTLEANSFKTNKEAFAAGFLEGAFQVKYIYYHKLNFFQQEFEETGAPEQSLIDFLEKQYNYTQTQIQYHRGSKYWATLGLFDQFFQGMIHGYNINAEKDMQLTLMDFLILQAVGELADLRRSLNPSEADWFDLPNDEFVLKVLKSSHCSVLLKIKDDLSDVFLGHNTWTAGQSMLRTYKFYNFGKDMKMQLSSYPGLIYSLDDYYLLQNQDQNLFVAETTNHVHRKELFNIIIPQTLFTWQRALIANYLATNGLEWTETFKLHNSGTYNNQYMVVDTKRFIPGVGAQPGFLWIVEQMPGLIINRDVTDVMVQQGNYWPSYNIPYIKEIYDYSGQDMAALKVGLQMTYDGAPRSKILKREHVNVQTLEDYKKVMRLNKFQDDEFSLGNPSWTLANRGDLYKDPKDRISYFATDAKITTYKRIVEEDGLTDIQNGPTHDDQPVFKWSDHNFTASHLGHPDVWDFGWVSARAQI